jgi:hypothetical protein
MRFPRSKKSLFFVGVGGKCCSVELHREYLDTKYSARIGRTEPGMDSASDGGRIRRCSEA